MSEIRLCTEKALDVLADVYVKAYASVDVGEKWDQESAHKLLQYWLKRQPDLFFLAETDSKIVGGFVAGIKPWWDGNHLVDGEIFVDPGYQGKGVGSELSKVMFGTAMEKYGARIWDAFTFRKPDFPKGWYQKLGFKEVKEWMMISGDLENALEILGK
ncbi:MAG: GCN5-related N-acetyltransferase [Candidatus Daviesbacteria bacterium GW2011_GWB1_41_5]|uniref:GCN5-related N-acetyltransferase n=1 Tax=Candidatus Daviesbacteria bacterium GW2011_GWB1_41_5 TaxID=1618429 RepID=A0A0G0WMJ2_9BACT|nr:MAG: GCN5-related N-acetyltransferase [Candidatus Daviesbacteria bacterium GW2011_GWB1_41_5]